MRKRVVVGERDVHGVVQEMNPLELLLVVLEQGRQGRIVEGQRDVDLAGLQARQRVLGLELGERELDGRVLLVEARDRQRHERRPGGREGGEAQTAAAQPGDGLELGLGRREAGEDRVRVLHERAARIREPDAAG